MGPAGKRKAWAAAASTGEWDGGNGGRTRCSGQMQRGGAHDGQHRPTRPTRSQRRTTLVPTSGPHAWVEIGFKNKPESAFSRKKNRYEMRKNLGNFLKVRNPIWNTFPYYNFFQFSTDFELIKRFWVKSSLTRFVLIQAYCSTHCNSTRALFWTRGDP
jgi:hypothetical protein